jgi:TetR/AcrR family transcriptional repressor of lmrAB and yxaGH operons
MNRRQPDLAVGGTRERLLEAALELMRESGLSGAGINEIVRESGAPKGSVYYFFLVARNKSSRKHCRSTLAHD